MRDAGDAMSRRIRRLRSGDTVEALMEDYAYLGLDQEMIASAVAYARTRPEAWWSAQDFDAFLR